MRRLLCSLMLKICLVVLLILPSPAAAAGSEYPYQNYQGPGSVATQYVWTDSEGRRYSPYGYAYRNCTDYVAWKAVSLGVSLATIKGLGHARNWDDAARQRGLSVGTQPVAWAVAVSEDGPYGHVAFVEEVYGSGAVTVSEFNVQPGAFGRRTGMPRQLGFTKFIYLPVAAPRDSGVAVKKTVGPFGEQQVYAATRRHVIEGWWLPGKGVQTTVVHAPGNIVGIDKKVMPDGTQLLYTAVEDGIWETWWRHGEGQHSSKIISLTDVKDVIAKVQPDGTHVLYVLAADGPYEYWWRDGGDGIHKERLAHIPGALRFTKSVAPDGTEQVYTATAGMVFEIWWRPWQPIQTTPVIHINQHDIVDVAKSHDWQGVQHLYTATAHGVWESWWRSGGGVGHSRIVGTSSTITRILKRPHPSGRQYLYVAAREMVDEYSWQPWEPLWWGRLLATSPITAIDQHSGGGVGQLYAIIGPDLYETWWGDGSVHTNKLFSLR